MLCGGLACWLCPVPPFWAGFSGFFELRSSLAAWLAESGGHLVPGFQNRVEGQRWSDSGDDLVEGELKFTPRTAGARFRAACNPRGKLCFLHVPAFGSVRLRIVFRITRRDCSGHHVSARAWLYGKLFVALLSQKLAHVRLRIVFRIT